MILWVSGSSGLTGLSHVSSASCWLVSSAFEGSGYRLRNRGDDLGECLSSSCRTAQPYSQGIWARSQGEGETVRRWIPTLGTGDPSVLPHSVGPTRYNFGPYSRSEEVDSNSS